MNRKTLVLFVLAGRLATIALGASALFTSQATVTGNTFTTGSVIISTSPTAALITYDNMAPGDVVVAPLDVKNDGTLDFRYAVSGATTDADNKHLDAQLVLDVKSGVSDCSVAGYDADGASIYSGSLKAAKVGDPSVGAQAGDRDLAAGAQEVLCFRAALPLGTGNSYQTATTSATFTFDAEQVKNNP
jgi:spore coat-associated protein N